MPYDPNSVLPNMSAPDAGGPEPSGLMGAIKKMFGGDNGGVPPVVTPYGDEKKILQTIKDFKEEAMSGRQVFERAWWRNLLYVLGRQWIYWDNRKGWVDKRLAKWVPRPVTNVSAQTVQTIRALFDSVQLGVIVRPVGSDPCNVMTAELADDMGPLIHLEHDMDRALREHDFWLVTCGNVFLHPWWDTNPQHGVIVVPHEQCEQCGSVWRPSELSPMAPTCPKCGGSTFIPATGPDGETTIPQGRGQTDVCSPFEIAVPMQYSNFQDAPGCLRLRFRPKRWYEDNLPDYAKRIQWESMPPDRSLQLLKTLATQSDFNSSTGYASGGVGEASQQGASEFELWLKPSEDYPEGLVARMIGSSDLLVTSQDEQIPGPLPLSLKDGSRIFPWIHTPFDTFAGRLWARSPLDQIIQKQDALNQLDSFTQLIVQRMANPVWLEPKGSEVRALNGEPGLVIKWNPIALGGAIAKPERIPGQEVPQSVMALRAQLIEDIEQATATSDILKGQKPSGVNAFSSLQLLVERSQSRFSMVLAARGETYRDWYRIVLEMERQYGPAQRTLSVLGPNRTWTVQSFLQSSLQGDVEIVVEDGSQAPKTNLGKRAAIEHASQLGLIDPNDPDQKYTILQTFGLTTLIPQLDAQVKGALQEQDAFEKWATSEQMPALPNVPGIPPLVPFVPSPAVVQIWHRAEVHLSEHTKWANGDKAREVFGKNPQAADMWNHHLMEHIQQMANGGIPPAMMPPPQIDPATGQPIAPQPAPQQPHQPQQPPRPGGAGMAMSNSNGNAGQHLTGVAAQGKGLPGAVEDMTRGGRVLGRMAQPQAGIE